jgi:hypothetical protein
MNPTSIGDPAGSDPRNSVDIKISFIEELFDKALW